jgi:hypothetical protein|tara:strand:+ start:1133 stop:1387 length:255 start_codon:yes stop_codon:yes gene_type:complete
MVDKEVQIKEGQDAKRILEEPLLIKSYEVIQNDIFQQWVRTEIGETDKRESLYHSLRGVLTAQNVLVNTMENGKILEEERKGGN